MKLRRIALAISWSCSFGNILPLATTLARKARTLGELRMT